MATFQGLNYITPITINSRERLFRSETINLKTQTVGNGAQRWDLVVTLEPATAIGGNAAGAALAVHRSTNGFSTSFAMEMPQYLGVAQPAAVSVSGAHSVGDSTITVDAANTTQVPAGRFLTFPGNQKVYQVTEAVPVPAVGTATLNIFPPLVANVADNAEIDWTPDITVYYAQDGVEGVTYTEGVLTRAALSVVEALQ